MLFMCSNDFECLRSNPRTILYLIIIGYYQLKINAFCNHFQFLNICGCSHNAENQVIVISVERASSSYNLFDSETRVEMVKSLYLYSMLFSRFRAKN